MVGERKIEDMNQGGDIHLPTRNIAEPSFGFGRGGDREFVLPGNREYLRGDRIARPDRANDSEGRAGKGSGESTDDFVFSLSREEFLTIFFDDLELPRMTRSQLGAAEHLKSTRAGYATEGSPANLSVTRILTHSLSRRIALKGVLKQKTAALETSLAAAVREDRPADAAAEIIAAIEVLLARVGGLPFLEEIDLRYRNRVLRPAPIARAVMFCMMDVSASMDETKKDLAKRFFTLLHLFLKRKYQQVELIFIRHTEDAEEVDEAVFFHDLKSGGTVVLPALELTEKIRRTRYAEGWNVYAAQASDGDAFGSDPARCARFLRETFLPAASYYAYIELTPEQTYHFSNLWMEYKILATESENFAMRRASRRENIYPVFRELFSREGT